MAQRLFLAWRWFFRIQKKKKKKRRKKKKKEKEKEAETAKKKHIIRFVVYLVEEILGVIHRLLLPQHVPEAVARHEQELIIQAYLRLLKLWLRRQQVVMELARVSVWPGEQNRHLRQGNGSNIVRVGGMKCVKTGTLLFLKLGTISRRQAWGDINSFRKGDHQHRFGHLSGDDGRSLRATVHTCTYIGERGGVGQGTLLCL